MTKKSQNLCLISDTRELLTADSSNLPTDNMTVKLCEFENICQLALLIPIPDEEKKLKAFTKPFEAPQRNVKIKI